MRLINCKTLCLEEFSGAAPSYAILSHTWQAKEVTFQDMEHPIDASLKTGFAKIRAICSLALENNLEYAWVDTCCIDKSSSAELTEAINSMFKWYEEATICFVFLSDLRLSDYRGQAKDDDIDHYPHFKECKWFYRGWTLQELIAPVNVLFYDMDAMYIGTKHSLAETLHRVTDTPLQVLSREQAYDETLIIERMSWAAGRDTTRIEDISYCLMGIFNVKMPLLYGEGHTAFIRLQEEIIKASDDRSIFGWKATPDDGRSYRGLLAHSPAEFRHARGVQMTQFRNSYRAYDEEYASTNKGFRIQKMLRSSADVFNSSDQYHQQHPSSSLPASYCLPLGYTRSVTSGFSEGEYSVSLLQYGPNCFVRSSPHELSAHTQFSRTHLLDPQYVLATTPPNMLKNILQHRKGAIQLVLLDSLDYQIEPLEMLPSEQWDHRNYLLFKDNQWNYGPSPVGRWRGRIRRGGKSADFDIDCWISRSSDQTCYCRIGRCSLEYPSYKAKDLSALLKSGFRSLSPSDTTEVGLKLSNGSPIKVVVECRAYNFAKNVWSTEGCYGVRLHLSVSVDK
jgi:hypothetical protein